MGITRGVSVALSRGLHLTEWWCAWPGKSVFDLFNKSNLEKGEYYKISLKQISKRLNLNQKYFKI